MRHLGEVAEGRDAGPGDLDLERRDQRRRHAQDAGGAGRHFGPQQPGRGFRAEDRHGSGMRHGRGDRPEADPLGDAQTVGELDDGVGHGPPAIVRLRADEHEEVAVGDAGPADHELGPGQLGEPAVDDLERGTAGAVVEERVRVEGRDDRGLAGDLLERGRGRRTGIDPAVERGEEGRGDEVARVVEGVQAHADRIGLTGRLPSPATGAGAGRAVSPAGRGPRRTGR